LVSSCASFSKEVEEAEAEAEEDEAEEGEEEEEAEEEESVVVEKRETVEPVEGKEQDNRDEECSDGMQHEELMRVRMSETRPLPRGKNRGPGEKKHKMRK
jgi:hypothetical protein